MILLSYDISDNKLRNQFSKYISKFGHRIQYSVFEIDNGNKVIENILTDIDNKFGNKFSESDSVIICKIKNEKDILKYGFMNHDDEDILIV